MAPDMGKTDFFLYQLQLILIFFLKGKHHSSCSNAIIHVIMERNFCIFFDSPEFFFHFLHPPLSKIDMPPDGGTTIHESQLLRAFGAPLSCLIRLLCSRGSSMTQQGGIAIFMAPS